MSNINLEPGHVTDIHITMLQPDPDQPRKTFDQDSLKSLADSLKVGVQVPLLVRASARAKYIIHDGERRWRAAKLAKLKTLPVLLINPGANGQGIRAAQLTVNNLREQLKPMEIARVLADMRNNNFASLNELAAYLESSGLPAMTKQQIGDLIALVELPEWAQDMIDAGVVEASAIRKLNIALPYKEVLKSIERDMQQTIEWRGRLIAKEVVGAISAGFSNNNIDLGHTQHYWPNPVHFNPKTACKGCEHLIKIDGDIYCMDQEAFEKKNAEAKAAGLLPGGVKPEKPVSQGDTQEQDQEAKKKQRAQTLGQKARDYLHTYLVERIVRHILGDAESRQIDITREILAWYAMNRPGEHSWREQSWYVRNPSVEKHQAAQVTQSKSLENLFAVIDLENSMLHAAAQVAGSLAWRETQVVCHQLWSNSIELVWKMDELFLKLFRKAELIHLATTHDLESPEGKAWDKLKLGELRTEILASADKVKSPQILQDIYTDVAEPYVSHLDRHHEDEDPE